MIICDSCNQPHDTTQPRPHGNAECHACWIAALIHGHAHGMHDDPVTDCPWCPDSTHGTVKLLTVSIY
jgi:hypothetical protein